MNPSSSQYGRANYFGNVDYPGTERRRINIGVERVRFDLYILNVLVVGLVLAGMMGLLI